jgi:hypothetical protein
MLILKILGLTALFLGFMFAIISIVEHIGFKIHMKNRKS